MNILYADIHIDGLEWCDRIFGKYRPIAPLHCLTSRSRQRLAFGALLEMVARNCERGEMSFPHSCCISYISFVWAYPSNHLGLVHKDGNLICKTIAGEMP